MHLIHLGGEHTVTGSCHLLQAKGINILVDCGMAQGGDEVIPMSGWPVSAKDIDYLFLTHAHIDHIGRIPELIHNGFKGERPFLVSGLSFLEGYAFNKNLA